ncbi:hypothetical protein L7F22_027875 [Adiantum nelumboides]|nr:hypothetical protein [Adiantum nelumboides]
MLECSICIGEAQSPVLTVCGHPFCWKCVYPWVYKKGACPVCKGALSLPLDFTPIYISSSNVDVDVTGADGRVEDTVTMGDGEVIQVPTRPSARRRRALTDSEAARTEWLRSRTSRPQRRSRSPPRRRSLQLIQF